MVTVSVAAAWAKAEVLESSRKAVRPAAGIAKVFMIFLRLS